jgi:hypothetical protein
VARLVLAAGTKAKYPLARVSFGALSRILSVRRPSLSPFSEDRGS